MIFIKLIMGLKKKRPISHFELLIKVLALASKTFEQSCSSHGQFSGENHFQSS